MQGTGRERITEKVWRRIDDKTEWMVLSRLRNSFLSRALTALSLTALILANAPEALTQSGLDLPSMRLVFTGSAVFLLGYVLFGLFAPPEFAQPGEIYDHVSRMQVLSDDAFVASRLGMAKKLLERSRSKRPMAPPRHLTDLLSDRISGFEALEADARKDAAPGLYHADLLLRQYDAPPVRLLIAAALLTGLACLLYPTITNVLKAAGIL